MFQNSKYFNYEQEESFPSRGIHQESPIRRFLGQGSFYVIGNLFVALAGFISFPVWTRAFSTAEYGVMGLITITVSFLSLISTLGLHESAIRFYSEFSSGKRDQNISSYYSTLILAVAGVTTVVGSIFFVVVEMLNSGKFFGNPNIRNLIYLAVLLSVIESLESILFAFLRAEQKAKSYAALRIFIRYGNLSVKAFLVFVLKQGLFGYFLGGIFVGVSVVIYLIFKLFGQNKLVLSCISCQNLKKFVRYGLPLVPVQLSRFILSSGDRYIIQYFLGAQALGMYSAGYNLTDYLRQLFTMPIVFAIMPIYLDLWEKKGPETTKAFLAQALDYLLMFGIPIILIFIFLSKDLIILLASQKFHGAHVIVPFIAVPIILDGLYPIYGAGLIINKKTNLLMYFTLTSGVLNVGLNLLIIPKMGIIGAAIATMLAYSFFVILVFVYAFKNFLIKIKFKSALSYLIASGVMIFMLRNLSSGSLLRIVMQLIIGLSLYAICIFVINGTIRRKLLLTLRS